MASQAPSDFLYRERATADRCRWIATRARRVRRTSGNRPAARRRRRTPRCSKAPQTQTFSLRADRSRDASNRSPSRSAGPEPTSRREDGRCRVGVLLGGWLDRLHGGFAVGKRVDDHASDCAGGAGGDGWTVVGGHSRRARQWFCNVDVAGPKHGDVLAPARFAHAPELK